ncbi:hypothetical protein FisN_25Hu199 [Fistulifera solaris]|uniref:Uncharacterized protein n=1 Tax=Fistulifera solaris TaxID=1519565 RepID=A0A1Z5K6W3_FISSO|nr:hypothetical protein FisN_25Hu199 [Fistulifera solaris]|eukprot:GAX22000.1 hypothetical protein FisN_25Hu199 [Fistulifera solaris]
MEIIEFLIPLSPWLFFALGQRDQNVGFFALNLSQPARTTVFIRTKEGRTKTSSQFLPQGISTMISLATYTMMKHFHLANSAQ